MTSLTSSAGGLPTVALFSDIGWALMNVDMRDWTVQFKFEQPLTVHIPGQ